MIKKESYGFDDFMDIIRELRSENGCPWDKEQTHESLKKHLIEESYETIEAIDNKDNENLCEELGDVLLQIALHSVIGEEKEEFTIDQVIDGVAKKMIRRHPHVFGDQEVKNSDEVLKNWEEIKQMEKGVNSVGTDLSDEMMKIPKAFPATLRAEKVQKKATKIGFDFSSFEEALDKVYEELKELEEAKKSGNVEQINEEYGDLMFSMVNLSRFLRINAENSLTNATDKFINRFVDVEKLANGENKHLSNMSIDELNALWGRVK